MDTDFLTYIQLISSSKAKENLKASLNEAISKEKWELVKEISDFLNIYLNGNIEEIKKLNSKEVNNSNQNEDTTFSTVYGNYEILEKLKDIIYDNIEILRENIDFDTVINDYSLYRSYGYTHPLSGSSSWSFFGLSKPYMELIMEVEEEFDIEIPDETAGQIFKLRDLYDVLITSVETTA